MTPTEQQPSYRLMGVCFSVYSLLLLLVFVHETTSALSASALWWNVLPVIGGLLGLQLFYGGVIWARRVAAFCNLAMVLCGLMILYQCLAFPWDLILSLCQHQVFSSVVFYAINGLVLFLFQWRLSRNFPKKSFWITSPWRAGIIGGLFTIPFLLKAWSVAWLDKPFELTMPARNLVQYLQGPTSKFFITQMSYQKQQASYQVFIRGYGFSKDRAAFMRLSWVPLAATDIERLKKAAKESNAQAQLSLGVAFLSNMGSQSDLEEAIHWFSLAAKKDNGDAQEALAIALINGAGVAQDIQQGYELLLRAAANKNPQAQWLLSKINQQRRIS